MDHMIYADNSATTKLSETALKAMMPYLTEEYGNPSSLYDIGSRARKAVEEARATVAGVLNAAKPGEIFFTSGGSEADNWAIKGAARFQRSRKGKTHIISTKFEHHAVLHTLQALEKEGFTVTLLDVHEDGLVRPEELEAAITEDTALVTVMYANNEIGTIQPIAQLGAICRARGVLFHTDAVQAVGHIPVDVQADHIDLLSLSGHKFHGPKGIGALYVRTGVVIDRLIEGGAQERGRRAGTENTPGIVGMAAALAESAAHMEADAAHLIPLRDYFISQALQITHSRLNGDPVKRLPGNVNLCFRGIEGESLLLMLDFQGICASSGSACTSGSLDPSHVLLAIGLPHEVAHGSLRLSFGAEITKEEVDYILEALRAIVERLRAMSPLWEEILEKERQQ